MTTAVAGTKRERLEKLVSDMKAAGDVIAAKRAKDEEPTAEECNAVVTMGKAARDLRYEIVADAKAAAEQKDAEGSLADAQRFLADLGMNPDAKAGDRPEGAEKGGRGATLAEQFMDSAQFKSALARFPGGRIPEKGSIHMDPVGFKALLTGANDNSGGAFVQSDRTGIYDTGPLGRTLTMRSVVTNGTTNSDTVEYARALTQVNNAAPVPEATSSAVVDGTTVTTALGGVKPESEMTFEKVTATVKTIAHWMAITRRALSDAGQLQTIINAFLTYGLEEELEDQMITGSGAGENFQGINTLAGVQTHAMGADTLLDAYRKARTKVRLVGKSVPNAYLMHPNDWQEVDLLRNSNADYYFGGPMQLGTPTLWGLPVVECEALTEGTAWVGDFRTLVLWDREQSSITVSDSHADFFVRNLLAILAEMRAAFGALRPAALVKITGI